jgi:hypothetical protein
MALCYNKFGFLNYWYYIRIPTKELTMEALLNYGLKAVPATKNLAVPAGVVKNSDGSISTVRTMSFQDDNGDQVLIPTVHPKGYIMSDKEAIEHYYDTNEHYGKFPTVEEANKAAQKLHLEHEKLLSSPLLAIGVK